MILLIISKNVEYYTKPSLTNYLKDEDENSEYRFAEEEEEEEEGELSIENLYILFKILSLDLNTPATYVEEHVEDKNYVSLI